MSVSEPAKTPELGAWDAAGDEPFGEWELPGMDEPAPDCGQVRVAGACGDHGHLNYEHHFCGRRSCPDCWSTQWAEPRTVSIIRLLAAARYAEPDGLSRRLVHAVVSPPEASINTIEGFYGGRSDALDIAKDHGIRGGVTVAHGYRVLEDAKAEYREADPDVGLWLWVRRNDRPWREQVYWSPHYHIIGLARDVEPGGEDVDEEWVFKNIDSLAPFTGLRDRDAYEDMARRVRYLLSHATFPAGEDRQASTWFGSLHGSNFQAEEELSDGSLAVIERVAEEIVGAELDEDDDEAGQERCDHEDCDSPVINIWRLRSFLEANPDVWDRERRERVRAAREWAVGLSLPPPGLKNPSSVEQAEEALQAML